MATKQKTQGSLNASPEPVKELTPAEIEAQRLGDVLAKFDAAIAAHAPGDVCLTWIGERDEQGNAKLWLPFIGARDLTAGEVRDLAPWQRQTLAESTSLYKLAAPAGNGGGASE